MVQTQGARASLLIAGLLSMGLSGCSGNSTMPSGANGGVSDVVKTAHASLVIRVPATLPSSNVRGPKYISSGTKSVAVAAGAGDQQFTFDFNVTPSSPNCTNGASGVSCTEQIDAPIGNDWFNVTAYDNVLNPQGQPQGNKLSVGSIAQSITEGTANTIKITMAGVPATANITIANPNLPQGSKTATSVTVDVRDADGFAIVGAYSQPIWFPCNPSEYEYWLAVSIDGGNAPWISSSSDTVQLTYFGDGIESPTKLTACLVGTSTVVGSAVLSPQPAFANEIPVSAPLDNASIVPDATGNLWFTEPSKSSIAQLSPGASQPLLYPVPSGAQPMRMTGPNPDHIYFTASNNSVGDLNLMNGSISEHPLLTPNAGLYGLGGQWYYDFSLWFTEYNAGKLGSMTTAGGINEYPIGNPKSTPAGMTYGPGGFYFADPGTNAIGIVNPGTGGLPTIKEYPLPTPSAEPLEVTNCYEASEVWFTEKAVSKVGVIDASGNIKEYASGGAPVAILCGGLNEPVFVLTAAHQLERYDINTGAYTTITPPSSSNGPVVGLDAGQLNQIYLLRSNGTTGAIQNYYF